MNFIEKLERIYRRWIMRGAALIADVSHWQGAIDWLKMASKVHAVYIRAGSIQIGDGEVYDDYRVEENIRGAIEVGLPFGLYWYFRPSLNPQKTIEQALQLVLWLKRFGFSLPPAIDVEENSGLPSGKVAASVKLFIDTVEQHISQDTIKGQVTLYSRIGFWNSAVGWGSWMANRLWWVARYKLSLTHPWSDNWKPGMPPKDYLGIRVWLHQKSADHNGEGETFGVSSDDIDINWYINKEGKPGTPAEFYAEFKLRPAQV